MKHFKLPLIVSGVVFVVMIGAVIGGIVWLDGLPISNQEKSMRGGKLGGGIATLGCFIMAPFWFIAAGRFGKERRQQLESQRQKANRKQSRRR